VIVGVGSFLTARWIVRPLQRLSGTARALGAGDLDARARIDRDDEIGEMGRAFDEMADRMQKLLVAERELLANVSHELRTPLARLRVALDIAGESTEDAGRLSMAEMAVDLAEIETLIDDIMTTARLEIEGGRAPAHFGRRADPIAPGELCQRAADRFRARHARRSLAVDVVAELPPVHVDAVLFRRMLDNLLENAHKYSPDTATPIELRALPGDTGVVFEVTDHGLGIATEDLPRVFEPFFRADRSRSRGTGGVGLGLTLAKRIVEAHGGTIDVNSTVGRGTTVRVVVPVGARSEGG
jgi:signal transduction histidine kinase